MKEAFDRFSDSSFSGNVSVTVTHGGVSGCFPAGSEHACSPCFCRRVRGRLVQSPEFLVRRAVVKQTGPTQHFLKTLSNPLLLGCTFSTFYDWVKFSLCYIVCICLDHSVFYLHIFIKLKIFRY